MPAMVMQHDIDPKTDLKDQLGDLEDVEIFANQLLVAVYIRPKVTKSGIYLTDKTTDEDRNQGKVGLVVKKGERAFVSDKNWDFGAVNVDLDEWVFFRASDGWAVTLTNGQNKVLCRILDDTSIRGRIQQPDAVW